MKLYSKLAILALAGCFMAACSDEDSYQPGAWDVAEDFQNVTFANTKASAELDPTDPTEAVIEVHRTEVGDTATVTYNIIENTDSVFTVGECKFAAGDSVAFIHVEFPNAEIGVPYTLQLQLTDPRFVSAYTTKNTVELTVTRVKWNTLGKCTIYDDFFFGTTGESEIFQRDDKPEMFRIYQPCHNLLVPSTDGNYYPFYKFSDFSANASEYLNFQILPASETGYNDLVKFSAINSGYFMSNYGADVYMYHPSAFTSMQDPSTWTFNKVVSWQENGLPGIVQLAPYYYMDGIGGWDYTTTDGMFVITFPGYVQPKKVDITQDVQYEEVFTGAFTSEQLGGSSTATLYEGTEITLTDNGADSTFLADFGKPYAIMGGYTDETVLYFCVDAEGNVRAPEFTNEDGTTTKLQALGFQAAGADVYAKINEGQSSFRETVITLNITFCNADESIVYGTGNEVLSNITYTTVGTADYGYQAFFAGQDEEGNPTLGWDQGLELQERSDMPGTYRILNWGNGTNFEFSINYETNMVTVPHQYVMTMQEGDVYVGPVSEVYAGYEEEVCIYDPEESVVDMHLAYYVPAIGQGFAPNHEYIILHIGEMPAEPAAAPKKAMGKRASNIKPSVESMYNPWGNAKKVSKHERFGKPVWAEFAR